MLESQDVALSSANAAPSPKDAVSLELKVQPADAIFGPGPIKDTGKVPEQKTTPRFGRLLRSAARALIVVIICGLAWAGGTYYFHGHSPLGLVKSALASGAQESPERDELVGSMRQMAEDIRGLKASVEAKSATQNTQTNPIQAANGVTISDLEGRIDKLETELTTKLSQVNEQLASIEQQISTSHAALASRAQAPGRHTHHLHDAFDPSRDPTAPGAPRPLGER